MCRLVFLILISSFGISYSQVEISGGIYSDSKLSNPIPKAKLILTSKNHKQTLKSDKNGSFKLTIENPDTEFTLEIKKKGYCTIVIENIFSKKHYLRQESKSKIEFDVILRKIAPVGDKGFEGSSEIVKRNQN